MIFFLLGNKVQWKEDMFQRPVMKSASEMRVSCVNNVYNVYQTLLNIIKQCLQCLLNIDLVKLEVNIFQAIMVRVWECLPLVHLPFDPSPKVKLSTSVKPLYILPNIFPPHPEPDPLKKTEKTPLLRHNISRDEVICAASSTSGSCERRQR